jgi:AcrR family transcriptional regulator
MLADNLRKQRTDGVEARVRLLHAALRLFADKGYSKTSTRDIAQAAEVNIAAIKYYFGDKATLYRAVFTEPIGGPCDHNAFTNLASVGLREALACFFAEFLQPLKQGELVQLCMRLHFREMLEPTGLWSQEIDNNIKPAHAGLVTLLARHLEVKKPDDDVHRLAFAIVGQAVQLFIAREVIDAIRPALIASPRAIDQWAERLVDYAEAMVAMEARRRKTDRQRADRQTAPANSARTTARTAAKTNKKNS